MPVSACRWSWEKKITCASFALDKKHGCPITIDAEKRELTLEVHSAELKKCKQVWNPAGRDVLRYTRGALAKYAAHVTSASVGTVTDMDLEL